MAEPRKPRIPDDETLRRITTRAVAEIVPHQEFVDGLRSGRPLRLKMGFDPTKPIITLGWAVGLRKLRQLQDLGHTVVVIIGDWTARIGDPSGASQTRPMLTADEVQANSQAILRQFYKVLNERRTEIRRQSEWFDKFDLTDVVRLTARFTVAQMLQRDDFAQRYADHRPIGIHELVYPLLQAYDSFAVEADVEFGGTDQKFNNLVGRELQRMLGQKAGPAGQGQAVFLVPLLVGLDGTQKMSQSLGNFIGIDDPPHDMYGKLMSIPDSLTMDYFELLTDVPDDELAAIRNAVAAGGAQAMDHKMRLAREIVAQFHSETAAYSGEEHFTMKHRERGVPSDIPVSFLSFKGFRSEFEKTVQLRTQERSGSFMADMIMIDEQGRRTLVEFKTKAPSRDVLDRLMSGAHDVGAERVIVVHLSSFLHRVGVAKSRRQAEELIRQGAVHVDDRVVRGYYAKVTDDSVVRAGRQIIRIADADRHPELAEVK